jgi:hypothetical protein
MVSLMLSPAFHRLLAVALLGTQAANATGVESAYAQLQDPAANFERCRAITDDAARLRCFETIARKPSTNLMSRTLGPQAGTWRLVRTPNPEGGADVVSLMQIADTARSDFDLAGLALRCQNGGLEVVIVLVGPLSLRARPEVVVKAGETSTDFDATVLPPGASVLLPAAASRLASGLWTTATELTVQIEAKQADGASTQIRGVIPLVGLASALPALLANCSAQ